MREIIFIHVGKAGICTGAKLWEYLAKDKGISESGTEFIDEWSIKKDTNSNEGRDVCFRQSEAKDRYFPRAVMVDLVPDFTDKVKNGPMKSFYDSSTAFLNGKEDTGGIYARGRYQLGQELIGVVVDRIITEAEKCDKMDGIFINHSLGGGTGSGFSALLLENLTNHFGKKSKIDFSIYPDAQETSYCVEPYNSVLFAHSELEHNDLNFMLDNSAIYDICQSLNISRPTESEINPVIAKLIANATSTLRGGQGLLHSNLNQYVINLAPFPRLHFPTISVAPLLAKQSAYKQVTSLEDVTSSVFSHANASIPAKYATGVYVGMSLSYSGDVTQQMATDALKRAQVAHPAVAISSWSPSHIRVHSNANKSVLHLKGSSIAHVARDACLTFNNTAVFSAWSYLTRKFDKLFDQKAFLHFYLAEGMEIDEFTDSRENLAALESDYEEVTTST